MGKRYALFPLIEDAGFSLSHLGFDMSSISQPLGKCGFWQDTLAVEESKDPSKQVLVIHLLNVCVDLTHLGDDLPVVPGDILLSKGADNALIEERGSVKLIFNRSF